MGTSLAERVTRDCACLRARHVHGTHLAYLLDRCRCVPCTSAASARRESQRRAAAYGLADSFVDAAPARERLQSLLAAGFSGRALTEASGLTRRSYSQIVNAAPRARRGAVEKVMGLSLSDLRKELSPTKRIPSAATRVRFEALMSLGWTTAAISEAGGVSGGTLLTLHDYSRVTIATAAGVHLAFDLLSSSIPAPVTLEDRRAVTRARRQAESRGYATTSDVEGDVFDFLTKPMRESRRARTAA